MAAQAALIDAPASPALMRQSLHWRGLLAVKVTHMLNLLAHSA